MTDGEAGVVWWNAASRAQRAHWLSVAGSAIPADAWSAYKRSTGVTAADVEAVMGDLAKTHGALCAELTKPIKQ